VGADGPVGVIFTRGGIAAAQPEEDLFD